MAFVLSPWYSTSLIFICNFKFSAMVRALYIAEVSSDCASFHLSISGWRALRYTFFISCESNARPFFFNCSFTNSPVRETIPISWPGVPSTAITSPCVSGRLFTFLKNSLRLFLKRTSTTSKAGCPPGSSILASQSNMLSLLHPPEPQAPLLRQPLGKPLVPVSHPRPLVHPWQLIVDYWLMVVYCLLLLKRIANLTLLMKGERSQKTTAKAGRRGNRTRIELIRLVATDKKGTRSTREALITFSENAECRCRGGTRIELI